MKQIFIINAENVNVRAELAKRTKSVLAEGYDNMEVSDGSHTFSELYEHRYTLCIALAMKVADEGFLRASLKQFTEGIAYRPAKKIVWRSRTHSDGSDYKGYFILGIGKNKGEQITYHLPNSLWPETEFAEELAKAPDYDGHSAEDVLKRIKKL